MPSLDRPTHLTLGALPVSDNQTRFSVWAPNAKQLSVQLVQRSGAEETVISSHALDRDSQGMFTGQISACPPGSLYRYQIDDRSSRPDPRTRFQPFGVHGPSQVVDPGSHQWKDGHWKGIRKRDLIIYEMHLGSFTEDGTYAAAIERLPELKNWASPRSSFFRWRSAPENGIGDTMELTTLRQATTSDHRISSKRSSTPAIKLSSPSSLTLFTTTSVPKEIISRSLGLTGRKNLAHRGVMLLILTRRPFANL